MRVITSSSGHDVGVHICCDVGVGGRVGYRSTRQSVGNDKRLAGDVHSCDIIPHQAEKKTLATEGGTVQIHGVDQRDQGLVVCLNGDVGATVNVLVEMFASPDDGETFLLNLSVALLSWLQGARSKGNGTPRGTNGLLENCTQTIAAGIGADADRLGQVEERQTGSSGCQSLQLSEGSLLGIFPCPVAVGFQELAEGCTNVCHVWEKLRQEGEHAQGAAERSNVSRGGQGRDSRQLLRIWADTITADNVAQKDE